MAGTVSVSGVGIASSDEFREWLKDQPREFGLAIAARAALRVLPIAFLPRATDEWVADHSLAIFRSLAISMLSQNISIHRIDSRDAAIAAVFVAAAKCAASSSAFAAAHSVAAFDQSGRGNVADAVFFAYSATDGAFGAAVVYWQNVAADCDWLVRQNSSAAKSAQLLTEQPLWTLGNPDWFADVWVNSSHRLCTIDQNYQLWTKWYECRIRGEINAFILPRHADETLQIRIFNQGNEWWSRGHAAVNADIAAWIEEANAGEILPEAEPQPQNTDVIVFRRDANDLIEVDATAGVDELLTTPEAQDRHREAVETVNDALSFCQGHNVVSFAAPFLQRYADALGSRVEDCKPGVLFQRYGRLERNIALCIAELAPQDASQPVPVRTQQIIDALLAIPEAHNAMSNFDPALARRARMLADPDAQPVPVSQGEFRIVVENAIQIGIVAEQAREPLQEIVESGIDDTNPENRETRRFWETAKNFPRVIISWLWAKFKANMTITAVGATAVWVISNETWLLKTFADSPRMISIIQMLLEWAKLLPLG